MTLCEFNGWIWWISFICIIVKLSLASASLTFAVEKETVDVEFFPDQWNIRDTHLVAAQLILFDRFDVPPQLHNLWEKAEYGGVVFLEP